jgi:hypothetical protein
MSFGKACSGSEIKGLPIFIWGGFGLPKCGDVASFVAFRSSYPLAGCSPAEPASVSLDSSILKPDDTRSMFPNAVSFCSQRETRTSLRSLNQDAPVQQTTIRNTQRPSHRQHPQHGNRGLIFGGKAGNRTFGATRSLSPPGTGNSYFWRTTVTLAPRYG